MEAKVPDLLTRYPWATWAHPPMRVGSEVLHLAQLGARGVLTGDVLGRHRVHPGGPHRAAARREQPGALLVGQDQAEEDDHHDEGGQDDRGRADKALRELVGTRCSMRRSGTLVTRRSPGGARCSGSREPWGPRLVPTTNSSWSRMGASRTSSRPTVVTNSSSRRRSPPSEGVRRAPPAGRSSAGGRRPSTAPSAVTCCPFRGRRRPRWLAMRQVVPRSSRPVRFIVAGRTPLPARLAAADAARSFRGRS